MQRPSRCGGTSERPCDITTEVMPVEKPSSANATSSSGTGIAPPSANSTQRRKAQRRADQDRRLEAPEHPVARSPEERSQHLRQRGDEQDLAAALEIVAVDVGEIRPAPKPDHQHEARIAGELHQEDAPDRRRADHLPDAGDAFAQRLLVRLGGPSRRIVADDQPGQKPDHDGDNRDAEKRRAPAERCRCRKPAARSQTARRASRRRDGCRPRSRTAPAETSARRARPAPSGSTRCRSRAARATTTSAGHIVRERKRRAAGTVTAIDTSMQSLGPKRSSATPSGNWVAAKQKK